MSGRICEFILTQGLRLERISWHTKLSEVCGVCGHLRQKGWSSLSWRNQTKREKESLECQKRTSEA